MSAVKGGVYQRGEFWLDLARGAKRRAGQRSVVHLVARPRGWTTAPQEHAHGRYSVSL